MKYLYPYECEKLKLSSPQELQSAIDGNRREGRRPSYGYDFSPVPTLLPTTPPHLNGGLLNGRPTSGSSTPVTGAGVWGGSAAAGTAYFYFFKDDIMHDFAQAAAAFLLSQPASPSIKHFCCM